MSEKSRRDHNWDLSDRLLEYSARIIRLTEALPTTRAGNHVAGRLLRSGTSPYPNHGEAQAVESPRDFIHKMKVCLKELRESERWIKLIIRVPMIQPVEKMNDILTETDELTRIFVSSIQTAESNAASN